MTRRERLIENYEDALFSLLMDEVAESEGKKAMEGNQRLRDNGEIEVPVSVRQRWRRVIAKRAVENDLRQFGHGVTRILTKVNGMEAFYIADGDIIQVVWGYGSNSQWLYYITGTHINIRTALDIAESII